MPGTAQIGLLGEYMYDAQATVGGVPCVSSITDVGYYYATLPSFDYDPSVAYDIVLYNDAGNTTLVGAVQYTNAATLVSIDPCIDRGEVAQIWGLGAQCPVGTTITLRGARFPAADTVTVQFIATPFWSPTVIVELLAVTRINSSTITATLPALDNATTAAVVYNAYGYVQVGFTSSATNITTNTLYTRLYLPPTAPNVTSVTSSTCDSVSALQLTNCRALAVITVVGSNLDVSDGLLLITSIGSQPLDYNYLLPVAPSWWNSSGWYNSLTNTSLVFTLKYFDADTNVQLQPDVVYTMVLLTTGGSMLLESNAFRLSLTYASVLPTPPSSSSSAAASASTAIGGSTAAPASTASAASAASSSSLSSGAIAGIVIAAVAVAVLLALVVVWLLRWRMAGGSPSWWNKSAGEGLQRSTHGGADSSSDAYTDVELQ